MMMTMMAPINSQRSLHSFSHGARRHCTTILARPARSETNFADVAGTTHGAESDTTALGRPAVRVLIIIPAAVTTTRLGPSTQCVAVAESKTPYQNVRLVCTRRVPGGGSGGFRSSVSRDQHTGGGICVAGRCVGEGNGDGHVADEAAGAWKRRDGGCTDGGYWTGGTVRDACAGIWNPQDLVHACTSGSDCGIYAETGALAWEKGLDGDLWYTTRSTGDAGAPKEPRLDYNNYSTIYFLFAFICFGRDRATCKAHQSAAFHLNQCWPRELTSSAACVLLVAGTLLLPPLAQHNMKVIACLLSLPAHC